MNYTILLTAAQGNEANPTAAIFTVVLQFALIGVAFYFLMIRPQKKKQRALDAQLASLEKGDSVLTTSGFYGVVIDIMGEVVIVEFGNNKNCRIPMKRSAIIEVERAE